MYSSCKSILVIYSYSIIVTLQIKRWNWYITYKDIDHEYHNKSTIYNLLIISWGPLLVGQGGHSPPPTPLKFKFLSNFAI